MRAVDPLPLQSGARRGRTVSHRIQRCLVRAGLLSSPMLCIGLVLLSILPAFL